MQPFTKAFTNTVHIELLNIVYYLPLDGDISAAARIIELACVFRFTCSGKEMQGNRSKSTSSFSSTLHKPNLAYDQREGHIIYIIPIYDQSLMESAFLC